MYNDSHQGHSTEEILQHLQMHKLLVPLLTLVLDIPGLDLTQDLVVAVLACYVILKIAHDKKQA